MRVGKASALQIAFFTYALLLLSVPIASRTIALLEITGQASALVTKATPFAIFGLAIATIPALRRAVARLLAAPVPLRQRAEVATVGIAAACLPFAYSAAMAAWIWATEGAPGVDLRIRIAPEAEMDKAFSPAGLVISLLLVPIVAPIVEEVIFRGFLYRTLEARRGWPTATVLTSTLFGLYHPHFHAAFVTSIVLICVMRRTGSLWAAIVVHAFGNLMLWWPLAGQFVFPHGVAVDALPAWRFHIAFLAFAIVALPVYIWMSRDRDAVAPTVMMVSNGAVSK